MDFDVPADYRVETKKREDKKITESSQRADKVVEHEGDDNTDGRWSTWNNSQIPEKEVGGTGYERNNRDHPDHSTEKIC